MYFYVYHGLDPLVSVVLNMVLVIQICVFCVWY